MWQQIVASEMGGRGWAETAKETPGFARSSLQAQTPSGQLNDVTQFTNHEMRPVSEIAWHSRLRRILRIFLTFRKSSG